MTDYAVVDPATGSTIREYPTITDAELEAALASANAAHAAWSATSVAERATVVRRIGELHRERAQQLGEIVSREMGKTVKSGAGEASFTGSIYDFYADHAESLVADEPIELLGGSGSAVVRRASLGVLLGIMPWNYPYYQVARFSAPNLIIGNAVLLKPAPQCPESAEAIAAIFRDAGVPDGVYTSILATNAQIAGVIADRRVQGISFTGSGRGGAAVAELAGRNLKKVVLELGGSDPFIVLATDDLDAVVEAAAAARVPNAGQACNAAKRFIIHEDLYDDFLAKFSDALLAKQPGDPADDTADFGPLSSSAAADRLEEQVERAVSQGATLVGGGREGNFFRPAILTDLAPDNPARREEFFGPVAQIYKATSEDEAIALANDTDFGLGSYVFTTDDAQAARVADRIEAGMVFVNTIDGEGPEIPFGGIKGSGFGRELGRFGADEFVNKKLIRVG